MPKTRNLVVNILGFVISHFRVFAIAAVSPTHKTNVDGVPVTSTGLAWQLSLIIFWL